MKTIDLNGTWWFKAIDTYKNLPSEKKNLSRWMQALVPGTVHLDLLRNKKIPDPFIRMNETEVQWVDSVGWLYRKEFVVDKEFLGKRKVCLLAEGLDTYANIRCNGVAVGETANMR